MLQSNSNDMNDEQLVSLIIRDDKAAFEELFRKYYKPLVRFAYYRIHSLEQSRDLVQDVFVSVWDKRKKLDRRKSIKAYLYKSIFNTVINYSSSAFVKRRSADMPYDADIADSSKNFESSIDLKNVIDKLPEKLKTVFILSRVEGYKYSEIAEICDISVKAVEKRMSKTFLLMRKVFKP